MDTRALWLQALVKLGRLSMPKIGTEDNLSDIGTKDHSNDKLQKHIELNSLIAFDVEVLSRDHRRVRSYRWPARRSNGRARSHRRLPSHRRCKSEHVHQRD